MKPRLIVSILIVTIFIILVPVLIIWYISIFRAAPEVCPQDAKLCADGSAVGRTLPGCKFAPCPAVEVPDGWLTFTDTRQGIAFKYPASLSTVYEQPVDWPPLIIVSAGNFSCVESPQSVTATSTAQKIINRRTYCVESLMGGAAGSTYTDYKYTTAIDGKLITMSFTWRQVQCYNYDDPKQSECLKERETFDLDAAVDGIISTVEFK